MQPPVCWSRPSLLRWRLATWEGYAALSAALALISGALDARRRRVRPGLHRQFFRSSHPDRLPQRHRTLNHRRPARQVPWHCNRDARFLAVLGRTCRAAQTGSLADPGSGRSDARWLDRDKARAPQGTRFAYRARGCCWCCLRIGCVVSRGQVGWGSSFGPAVAWPA